MAHSSPYIGAGLFRADEGLVVYGVSRETAPTEGIM
jgi:hypothetical protein